MRKKEPETNPNDIVHMNIPIHRWKRDAINAKAKLAGANLPDYVSAMCIDGKLQRKNGKA